MRTATTTITITYLSVAATPQKYLAKSVRTYSVCVHTLLHILLASTCFYLRLEVK